SGKTMAIHQNVDLLVAAPAAQAECAGAPALPEEYRARLLSLRRRHNWDGEGAKAVTAAACRAALKFIEAARCRPSDLPLPRPAALPERNENLSSFTSRINSAREVLQYFAGSATIRRRCGTGKRKPTPAEMYAVGYRVAEIQFALIQANGFAAKVDEEGNEF